jgi:hypothetical protein
MWTVVSGVISLIVVTLIARPVGRALKARPAAWYIAASVVVFVAALALILASLTLAPNGSPASDALMGVALGFGFGGLAGLRYGYKGLFEIAAGKGRS